MRRMLLVIVTVVGCTTTEPAVPDASLDAAPSTPDAMSCGKVIPPCGDIDPGCATGTIPIECTHSEDPTVCWCPGVAVGAPHGWCHP